MEWDRAPLELISNAAPWRTFRWRHGQKHYSGTYWSATERAHVIYESRLELARLLFADFDPAVTRIIAQPFMIRALIEKRARRHVPDYLLLTDDGPVVVDVKPRSQLDEPKVKFTLDWTRTFVERRGWRYEVWSEPPATELNPVSRLTTSVALAEWITAHAEVVEIGPGERAQPPKWSQTEIGDRTYRHPQCLRVHFSAGTLLPDTGPVAWPSRGITRRPSFGVGGSARR